MPTRYCSWIILGFTVLVHNEVETGWASAAASTPTSTPTRRALHRRYRGGDHEGSDMVGRTPSRARSVGWYGDGYALRISPSTAREDDAVAPPAPLPLQPACIGRLPQRRQQQPPSPWQRVVSPMPAQPLWQDTSAPAPTVGRALPSPGRHRRAAAAVTASSPESLQWDGGRSELAAQCSQAYMSYMQQQLVRQEAEFVQTADVIAALQRQRQSRTQQHPDKSAA